MMIALFMICGWQGALTQLACFFVYHVLWPQGFDAWLEWFPALTGVIAIILLFKSKVAIVQEIGVSAAAGWLCRSVF